MTSKYGRRGERPFRASSAGDYWNQPGVVKLKSGEVAYPIDIAGLLKEVKLEPEEQHQEGLVRLEAKGLLNKLRPYQLQDAFELAARDYAISQLMPRAGKSLTSLAAATVLAAKKILIIPPKLGRMVWADEIKKWLGEESVFCEGRGANQLRDPFTRKIARPGKTPDRWKEFKSRRWTICNYDLFLPQTAKDAAGGVYTKDHLPGWGDWIYDQCYDLVIMDECHILRGANLSKTKKGKREYINEAIADVDTVWGLTATPMFGKVADYWAQLDLLSKGAVSGDFKRTPFNWHIQFSNGHRGEYGWVYDGTSESAKTILPERLKWYVITHPREEIFASMPKKTRSVTRIDDDKLAMQLMTLARSSGPSGYVPRAMNLTADVKIEACLENVTQELAVGEKVIIWVMLKATGAKIAKELQKLIKSKEFASRQKQVDAQIWVTDGAESADTRVAKAGQFREHSGAGIFIATIDSCQVAISLAGATTQHFLEVHSSPSAMIQVENRPVTVDSPNVAIRYYLLAGSVDERAFDLLSPKLEALAAVDIQQSDDSTAMVASLSQPVDFNALLEDLKAASMPGLDEVEDDE